jgi:hypothetical protein
MPRAQPPTAPSSVRISLISIVPLIGMSCIHITVGYWYWLPCCVVGDVDYTRQAPKAVIFTLRQVSVGEQLLFDYGPKYWEGRAGPSSPEMAQALVGGADEEQVIDWDQAMEELD